MKSSKTCQTAVAMTSVLSCKRSQGLEILAGVNVTDVANQWIPTPKVCAFGIPTKFQMSCLKASYSSCIITPCISMPLYFHYTMDVNNFNPKICFSHVCNFPHFMSHFLILETHIVCLQFTSSPPQLFLVHLA